jgi:hypothetical protein
MSLCWQTDRIVYARSSIEPQLVNVVLQSVKHLRREHHVLEHAIIRVRNRPIGG